MRAKEIIQERLSDSEWSWMTQAISTSVDAAYNPPPTNFQELVTRTIDNLNQNPDMIAFKKTLDKPLRLISSIPDVENSAGFAGPEFSDNLLSKIKRLWNVKADSWVAGLNYDGRPIPKSASEFKGRIEFILGHELSHIKQFQNMTRAGHVQPGSLKSLGYEITNAARRDALDLKHKNDNSLVRIDHTAKSNRFQDFYRHSTYRLSKQEFDAFAISLGSSLRTQYGDQASNALKELMAKIPQAPRTSMSNYIAGPMVILGKTLDEISFKSVADLWMALEHAEQQKLLKGNKQDLWKKFIKETSRYTQQQGTDKLAAKALERQAKMNKQQLKAFLGGRLPQLLTKGLLKSIPLAGPVIGMAFGIKSLIKGDTVGAALEVGTSFGSLITAIPGIAYIAARDMYSEYYTGEDGKLVTVEADMLDDPQGTKTRIDFLMNEIKEELETQLKQATTAPQPQPSQGLRNRDTAVKNWSTPTNKPIPEPQQENLERILSIAKY